MTRQALEVAVAWGAIAIVLAAASPAYAADPQTQHDRMSFARGARTWADNCMRCHNLRDPKDFRDDQWRVIMSHMRIRAGLTGQEQRDVLKFLQGSN